MHNYRKVTSSRLFWLVAHTRIFRLFMKREINAYVLWPLAKRVQNWILDRSTARNFTVYKCLAMEAICQKARLSTQCSPINVTCGLYFNHHWFWRVLFKNRDILALLPQKTSKLVKNNWGLYISGLYSRVGSLFNLRGYGIAGVHSCRIIIRGVIV